MDYLRWLTYCVWIPQLLLLATNFKIIVRYWRTILFCIFWALIFSVPWDLWAIGSNIWMFPPETNVGLWFGLPLEEYFFIIFVTVLISSLTIVVRVRLGHWLVDR
jgi:lycopene cyclase domain-containing protein